MYVLISGILSIGRSVNEITHPKIAVLVCDRNQHYHVFLAFNTTAAGCLESETNLFTSGIFRTNYTSTKLLEPYFCFCSESPSRSSKSYCPFYSTAKNSSERLTEKALWPGFGTSTTFRSFYGSDEYGYVTCSCCLLAGAYTRDWLL